MAYILLAHFAFKIEYFCLLFGSGPFFNRSKKHVLRSPSKQKPVSGNKAVNAKLVSQFRYTSGCSIDCKNMITRPVSGLFFLRCPFAIFRAVIMIVFDAFETFSNWSFSHVIDKVFKLYTPSWAYGNSTATVSIVVFCRRLITTFNHRSPTIPSGRTCHSVLFFEHVGIVELFA